MQLPNSKIQKMIRHGIQLQNEIKYISITRSNLYANESKAADFTTLQEVTN